MTEVTMQAGRELDALVAGKVMGLEPVEWSGWPGHVYLVYGDQETGGVVPRYSTDIAAAWEVVERLDGSEKRFGIHRTQRCPGDGWKWEAHFAGKYIQLLERRADAVDYFKCADTAPHAICLAALKAVGVDV